jgi:hypothetical protein
MATTMFFESIINDAAYPEKGANLDVEFGRTSFLGKNQFYLRVGDTQLILDENTEQEFFDAISSVGTYLGRL